MVDRLEGEYMPVEKIEIEVTVEAPIRAVWHHWNTPSEIMQWNTASEDWHTTKSEVDLRVGGTYSSRMEAKDGSFGFDFAGTYTRIEDHRLIESKFWDRVLLVEFVPVDGGVIVRETFDPEQEHSIEQQRSGWLAILTNFKKHVESALRA
jgi:uncharacterized protein YndB with AHSA1/START domain